jgi:hypothetical protein
MQATAPSPHAPASSRAFAELRLIGAPSGYDLDR